jgi:hypothetical protein
MDVSLWIPVISVVAGALATGAGAGINALFSYLRENRQREREDKKRREEWQREDQIRAAQDKREEERQRHQDRLRVYKNFVACTTFAIPSDMGGSREQLTALASSYLELLAHPAPSDTTKQYARDLYEAAQAALDIVVIPVEADDRTGTHQLEYGPLARSTLKNYQERIEELLNKDEALRPGYERRLLPTRVERFTTLNAIRLEFLQRRLAEAREQFLEATLNEVQ